MGKKFYGVRVGREVGVYETWKECQEQTKHFSKAEFKSFPSREEAEEWVYPPEPSTDSEPFSDEESSEEGIIKVYTDGACSNNGTPYAKAGIGVFFSSRDPRNFGGRIRGKQTNNVAEVKAVIKAYQILKKEINRGERVIIYSDSMYTIRAVGEYGRKQEKKNWSSDIPNRELLKKVFEIFQGKDNVEFRHVLAHTGKTDPDSLGNEGADRMATSVL
jgi:ribonuclease HI